MILLQADVLELKANPKADASGIIIESEIDFGRGPLATVIVQRGTLRVGDAIVSGSQFAKVRAMFDDQGLNLKEAPPAMPVRVIGWSGTPESGASFKVVKNIREAENLAEEEQLRSSRSRRPPMRCPRKCPSSSCSRTSPPRRQGAQGHRQDRRLRLRRGAPQCPRGHQEHQGLARDRFHRGRPRHQERRAHGRRGRRGHPGFHTKLENGVTPLAKHHKVRIETFDIIYELGDKVRDMMADLLDPDLKEIKLGGAEVRAVFPLAKGFVAGCLVTEGKITRNASARLRRKKEIVHEGKIHTLKRFKDDANEVRAGLECGIKLDDFNGYEVGDVIEVYEVQKVRATL
jgi:translation initiation factor IF-2